MAQHIWSLREGESERAGQREEITFPEFCVPAWLISLSGLILRADTWEEFLPAGVKPLFDEIISGREGGLHCFLASVFAGVCTCGCSVSARECLLHVCVMEIQGCILLVAEYNTMQKLFLTRTLCSIWPQRRGAGQDERWPSLSLL